MEAHRKRLRSQSLGAQLPLKARPDVPTINMKHRSYYEIVENEDKKKKLEVKVCDENASSALSASLSASDFFKDPITDNGEQIIGDQRSQTATRF